MGHTLLTGESSIWYRCLDGVDGARGLSSAWLAGEPSEGNIYWFFKSKIKFINIYYILGFYPCKIFEIDGTLEDIYLTSYFILKKLKPSGIQ